MATLGEACWVGSVNELTKRIGVGGESFLLPRSSNGSGAVNMPCHGIQLAGPCPNTLARSGELAVVPVGLHPVAARRAICRRRVPLSIGRQSDHYDVAVETAL